MVNSNYCIFYNMLFSSLLRPIMMYEGSFSV